MTWFNHRLSNLLAVLTFVSALEVQLHAQTPDTVAGRTLDQWSELTTSENRTVRLRAIRSLAPFGSAAGPALTRSLQHEDPAVRYLAAVQLGLLADTALRDAQPQLHVLLADEKHPAVQLAAAFAICRHEPTNEDAQQQLIKALDAADRGTACTAAELLGQLGPAANAAIPALEQAYRQESERSQGVIHVGKAAQNALRKIVPGWTPTDLK